VAHREGGGGGRSTVCGTTRGSSDEDGAAPTARGALPRRGGARGPTHEEEPTVR
jgi:hypothetical protein